MRARLTATDGSRVIENERIRLSSGTHLAARIWLPAEDASPSPAILEFLPYRRADRTVWQDSTRHPYFASKGYACVRVDIQGTGDSEGLLLDEYLPSEQEAAVEVIAWIASRPWCDGNVGMIGYSWGGFNGLQTAALRPAELKAVVALHCSDDRYTGDCHYMGGSVLAADMLRWAQTMRAINALPPDADAVGEGWREMWLERLRQTPHFAEAWLSHQRKDEYWRQGSIAEDYAAIQAPTLLVGGWADAYTDAVPRMLEHLECPRAGIIGPWAHMFPERGVPGPPIGFLQRCTDWFDRWLRGAENDVDSWPMLTAWMQEPAPPADYHAERPGRWVAFEQWPPGEPAHQTWLLESPSRLIAEGAMRSRTHLLEVATDLTLGVSAGVWCANGLHQELPVDQQADDAKSLVFDSEPLGTRIELFGTPKVMLQLAANQTQAQVVVRLCDLGPDGTSTLLSYGVLNLTHRDGHAQPSAVEPGRLYEVVVPLKVLGQAVEAGHRLRVAISPSWWPMLWPCPRLVTLSVRTGTSALVLPILSGAHEGELPRPFGQPEYARPVEMWGAKQWRKRQARNSGNDFVISEQELHESTLVDADIHIREENDGEWRVRRGDPLSARTTFGRDYRLVRAGSPIRVLASATMDCDENVYRVTETLQAFEGDLEVFSTNREFSAPRDFT